MVDLYKKFKDKPDKLLAARILNEKQSWELVSFYHSRTGWNLKKYNKWLQKISKKLNSYNYV